MPNDGYLDFLVAQILTSRVRVDDSKEGGRANVGLVTTDKKGAIKYLESFINDTYLKGKPTVNPPWRRRYQIRPFEARYPSPDRAPRPLATACCWLATLPDSRRLCSKAGPTSHCGPGERRQTVASAIKENDLSSQRLMAYERAWKKRFPPIIRF